MVRTTTKAHVPSCSSTESNFSCVGLFVMGTEALLNIPLTTTPSAQPPLPQVNSPQIQTRFYGRSRRRSYPHNNTHTRSPPCRAIAASSLLSERVEKRLSLRQRRNGRRQRDGFTATIQTALHSTSLLLTINQPNSSHLFLPHSDK